MVKSNGEARNEIRNVDDRNSPLIQAIAPVLVFGSLITLNAVGGVYAGMGRDLPESFFFLGSFCVSMSVVVWFWSYSRLHHIAWVLDMGWFLLIAWIVVVPYYLLKYEGKRGLRRIGLFGLVYVFAWLLGVGLVIAVRLVMTG
jgi:hypothetical protein